MFTRVVELTCKSGKAKELADTIDEKAMPILKKTAGLRRRNGASFRRGAQSNSGHQHLEQQS
jgi:hypothetical protein